MLINLDDARATLTQSTETKESEEGQVKHMNLKLKLSISVKPQFLDEYLEGHLTGAQPSDVLWKAPKKNATDKTYYRRYPQLETVTLQVSKDRGYGVKLWSLPPDQWDGDPKVFPGYREVTLMGGLLKKLTVDPGANGGDAKFAFFFENQPVELGKELLELSLLEEVGCDVWLLDRDMFQAKPTTAAPGADDDKDDDEETGAGAPE